MVERFEKSARTRRFSKSPSSFLEEHADRLSFSLHNLPNNIAEALTGLH